MELRKEIADLIAKRSAMAVPQNWEVPIYRARELQLPVPEVVGIPEPIHSVEHRYFVGPTSYLPLRIYRPNDKKNLPAMIFYHGGGWVMGTLDSYEQFCRSMANKLEAVVIAVNYQKAPEHPFPTPFNDCYATLKWVVANADQLGIDRQKIGVGGDSAGGNLAAAVAYKNRDENFCNLAFQLLIYPCTIDDLNTESAIKNATGYGLTRDVMIWFINQYVVNKDDLKNPYAFPGNGNDFKGLPPAMVLTASYDVLQDDGIAYANKLRNAGVKVVHRNYEDANHGCVIYAGISDYSEEIQAEISMDVKGLLQ